MYNDTVMCNECGYTSEHSGTQYRYLSARLKLLEDPKCVTAKGSRCRGYDLMSIRLMQGLLGPRQMPE